jgi:hypothetical protein
MPRKSERRPVYGLSRRKFEKSIRGPGTPALSKLSVNSHDRTGTGLFRLILTCGQRPIWWPFFTASIWMAAIGWVADRSPGRILAYQACATIPALLALALRYVERRLFDDE